MIRSGAMKRLPLYLAIALAPLAGAAITSCDQQVVKVTQCALTDGKLSIAFRDPARAKKYLTTLGERLKAKEAPAINEAADLVARIVECLD